MTIYAGAGGYLRVRALAAWRVLTAGFPQRLGEPGAEHLLRRQAGICYLCPEPMDIDPRGRSRNLLAWTIEHVFPRALGGRSDANRLLAHASCNTRKADRWPYPCEVVYLAAVYAPPHDAPARREAAHRLTIERNERRRHALERMHA